MNFFTSILTGTLALSLLLACDSQPEQATAPPSSEVKIFASNYPLAYFAQSISGKPALVYFPKIEGDPAFWVPEPESINRIQQCTPLFLNGANYEKWLGTVTLPQRNMVDTSSAFQDQLIESKAVTTHQHGPDGDHSHHGTAFTTWLDLSLAQQQALTVGQSLLSASNKTNNNLQPNLDNLVNELEKLDTELKQLTGVKPKLNLIASHPVYQYFGRAYNLKIHSMLWEPEIYPSEAQWIALEKILATHPSQWMIWEAPPLEKSVQRLKKMGLVSVVFDPCANTPAEGDFISVMKQNIENLRPIFAP